MAKKYSNLNSVSLFGSYKDPYSLRRGTGPRRPSSPLPSEVPHFRKPLSDDLLYFSWLGHSSVFLRMHGQNILIDPVFSSCTSPVPFLGPKRFPGQVPSASDFPEIDLVLITHNHYDHLDRHTIRILDPLVKQYVVPCGVGQNLKRFGISGSKVTELNWYESKEFHGLSVICTPSQHGSARSLFDRDQTLWCSYVLKDDRHTVFDTGDGGFGDHFSEIHSRYGDIDLAIMECGQYNEKWHGVHMFPEESAEASQILHAKLAVPVHWGAYVLSDHPWDDPPRRFAQMAQELGVPVRIPIINELVSISK